MAGKNDDKLNAYREQVKQIDERIFIAKDDGDDCCGADEVGCCIASCISFICTEMICA